MQKCNQSVILATKIVYIKSKNDKFKCLPKKIQFLRQIQKYLLMQGCTPASFAWLHFTSNSFFPPPLGNVLVAPLKVHLFTSKTNSTSSQVKDVNVSRLILQNYTFTPVRKIKKGSKLRKLFSTSIFRISPRFNKSLEGLVP